MMNPKHKSLLRQTCLFLFLCAWYPSSNPVLIKLFFLLLLVLFNGAEIKKHALFSMIGFCLILVSILHSSLNDDAWFYNFKFYLQHFYLYLAFLVGAQLKLDELKIPCFLAAVLNLIFVCLQSYELFPWEISQPMILKDQIFLAQTYNHPGIYSNPSPMALMLFLGMIPLIKSRWQIKSIYYLLILFPLIQADTSSSAIFIILGGIVFFFDFSSQKKTQILMMLGSGFMIAIVIFLLSAREGTIDRTFTSRKYLWNIAWNQSEGFFGKGPSHFHRVSAQNLPPETGKKRIPRNQFHPHNDLLYHLLGFGYLGLFFQLSFYALLVYAFYRCGLHWFAILILSEFQFSPNLLNSPAGEFVFLLCACLLSRVSEFQSKIKVHSSLYLLLVLIGFLSLLPMFNQSIQLRSMMENPQSQVAKIKDWIRYPSVSLDYNFAVAAYKRGDFEIAIVELEKLQSIAPALSYSNYILALSLAQTNQLEKAYKILEKALKIDPFHLYSYLLLSDIYEKTDQLSKALAITEEGIRCLGEHPQLVQRLTQLRSL